MSMNTGVLHRLYSPSTRIRLCIADVCNVAQELRTRHLSGPAAGHKLSEALVGVTILSEDAGSDDECVVFRGQVDGPLKGFLVEANGAGGLRGYTHTKIINDIDEADHTDTHALMGIGADIQVVRSLPTRILDQAQLRVVPPSIQVAVAKYFNESMQIPTAIEICVASNKEQTTKALGLAAQRMPDSDLNAFIRVLEAFNAGKVRDLLQSSDMVDADRLANIVGLPDLALSRSRTITFECKCSRARVIASLHALSLEERMEMLSSDETHHIICHLCGEDYMIENCDIPPPV